MTTNTQRILVVGATGNQGGAVVQHLLKNGWPVRALTRDTTSDKAKALTNDGAEVVQGDLVDRASLDTVLQGVYGVFGVLNFGLPGVGPEGEVRQGTALADAAKASGVQHFVFSSVGGAERHSGILHFESKWQVEQHIRALGLPSTMLRPVAFMDNYTFLRPMILNGIFPSFGLRPDKTMQLVTIADLAAFTFLAFANPERYLGAALEIAGDELTSSQTAAVFSHVIGRPVHVQDGAVEGLDEQDAMLRWFNEHGYAANIPSLRELHPELLTLEPGLGRRDGRTLNRCRCPPRAKGLGKPLKALTSRMEAETDATVSHKTD